MSGIPVSKNHGINPTISKAVREEMGIEAPKPCGIEFNKDSCPVCGKE